MSAKFTPGPWTLSRKMTKVPKVRGGVHNHPIANVVNGVDGDAHLIAAAPDLYEVLERWRSLLIESGTARLITNDIGADVAAHLMLDTDTALAKARGEA